jgi:serine/threonine-protein kinase
MSPSIHPSKIGRYPVVRLIGRGAMGSVYLARDTELDRDVAIKTVRNLGTTVEERESFLVRFRNEAKAVGRLRHPSIVAVYDVGTDEQEGPYLVFEYVEGATLKELLRAKGPLEPSELLSIAEQMADALTLAHREGIIHRDIKPENLLVGDDGITRLLDFGVARVPDAALTGEGQFLGTPCYGAPEMLRGGAPLPASDQFSFAAVIYEAASGSRAFPGTEAIAVAHRVVHEDPPPASEVKQQGAVVPKALDAVLARGLAKRPEDRYESVAQLVSAVRNAYASAGLLRSHEVADTLPLLRMSEPAAGMSSDGRAAGAGKRFALWPFAVALAIGMIAMLQLAPSVPAGQPSDDPNAGGAGADDVTRERSSAGSQDGRAAGESGNPDATAAVAKADAGPKEPLLQALSGFEREERAKDALERAERALEKGDKEAARAALDEAFRYDPEHPDIEALRRKL